MTDIVSPTITKYCKEHTSNRSELLDQLQKETKEKMAMPQMLCGSVEGALLKLLVQISGAKNAIEIGMFTGYSALCIAEGLPKNGQLISCEINPEAAEIAKKYFAKSHYGSKIKVKLQDGKKTIFESQDKFDFAFIDADKENYLNYFELLLPKMTVGGLIVFDNTLWGGSVLNPNPQNQEEIVLARLNSTLKNHPLIEVVLLPVRDGISIARIR